MDSPVAVSLADSSSEDLKSKRRLWFKYKWVRFWLVGIIKLPRPVQVTLQSKAKWSRLLGNSREREWRNREFQRSHTLPVCAKPYIKWFYSWTSVFLDGRALWTSRVTWGNRLYVLEFKNDEQESEGTGIHLSCTRLYRRSRNWKVRNVSWCVVYMCSIILSLRLSIVSGGGGGAGAGAPLMT